MEDVQQSLTPPTNIDLNGEHRSGHLAISAPTPNALMDVDPRVIRRLCPTLAVCFFPPLARLSIEHYGGRRGEFPFDDGGRKLGATTRVVCG